MGGIYSQKGFLENPKLHMSSNERHDRYMGHTAYRERLLRPIYGSCGSQRVNQDSSTNPESKRVVFICEFMSIVAFLLLLEKLSRIMVKSEIEVFKADVDV